MGINNNGFEPVQFRDALGRFTTGVCVVTAAIEGAAPFGMTINSFASLSLAPPLVLWSLQKNSGLAPQWAQAGRYAINILSADQQSLANRYARKDNHQLAREDYHLGGQQLPLIDGAIASLECAIAARHDGGDHIILVGEVLGITLGENTEPLVFYGGQYAHLGER
jgi:flavin reductase (DIM6/NTAB) family NADH-FMN oxidoreductase RutF